MQTRKLPATPRQGVFDPHLRAERALWKAGKSRVVGVDECGVGSLCAAVVAAACLVPANCRRIPGVRDSKMLSAAARERLAVTIRRKSIAIGIGAASVEEIERLNIYHATHLAMRRALRRIGDYDHVLIDGRAIAHFDDIGPHTTIVDGDASSFAIACASIIAKVTRDRLLRKLASRHPLYGWEHNAGYNTKEHREALLEHGLTPFHRRTYAPVRAILGDDSPQLELVGLSEPVLTGDLAPVHAD